MQTPFLFLTTDEFLAVGAAKTGSVRLVATNGAIETVLEHHNGARATPPTTLQSEHIDSD